MLKQSDLVKLLNRPLTSAETTNFDLYLKISTQRLEELLCIEICGSSEERTYSSRYGYRTVYVDPFTEINSVTIDGNEVSADDYIVKQNDKFNGLWYNIIEFDRKRDGDYIVVDAEWGFDKLPVDLQLLLARLFDHNSSEQTAESNIKSKKIEDFTVTYKEGATYDEFILANASAIEKYSQCNQSAIRHGYVRGNYDLRSVYPY